MTTAVLDWFDDGCCDVKYLDLWEGVPVSYSPGMDGGPGWHHDLRECTIGNDESGRLFQKAADRLMRYRFYPRQVMSIIGDFDLGKPRWLQVRDRIVQRIHLITLLGRNIVDVISMVEVSQTIREPRRCGFTYVTVATHVEQGAWSAEVAWQENGDVSLTVKAVSRPRPEEPLRNHRLIRRRQLEAYRQGLAHFKRVLLEPDDTLPA